MQILNGSMNQLLNEDLLYCAIIFPSSDETKLCFFEVIRHQISFQTSFFHAACPIEAVCPHQLEVAEKE